VKISRRLNVDIQLFSTPQKTIPSSDSSLVASHSMVLDGDKHNFAAGNTLQIGCEFVKFSTQVTNYFSRSKDSWENARESLHRATRHLRLLNCSALTFPQQGRKRFTGCVNCTPGLLQKRKPLVATQ
jgi:hypothetical protein